jgi:hypothetical protein
MMAFLAHNLPCACAELTLVQDPSDELVAPAARGSRRRASVEAAHGLVLGDWRSQSRQLSACVRSARQRRQALRAGPEPGPRRIAHSDGLPPLALQSQE